jgi:peptidoglycan hydrolase-like protein with peptidoglycan-binding domain
MASEALCSKTRPANPAAREKGKRIMRKTTLPIFLVANLAVSLPAHAEPDFGKIVTDIAQSLISQDTDRTAYLEAQRRNTVNGYRNYLTRFPMGAFRVNAEQSLMKLGATADVAIPPPTDSVNRSDASVEASIGLSRSQRIVIQRQLTSIGYPTGTADGLWGTNTRRAIAKWQTTNKLHSTGYVTAQQVQVISQQAGTNVVTDPAGTTINDDPVEERLLSLTYQERREVQRRLTLLGYSTRGVDGSFGTNTRRALASWQRDEGLRASGYLTADQLRALRRDTGG